MTASGTLTRIVLVLALIAGFSYLVPVILGHEPPVVWKGAGVALLALWCGMQAQSADGWLITAVMALGGLGDVLLEIIGESAGAGAFLIGHIIAITLYLRNRRVSLTFSQKMLAAIITPVVVFKAYTLPADLAEGQTVAIYALFLGAMAATAWISRFPRYWTGIGAMLFVASDLLIFARMGAWHGAIWINGVIWALYFAGQAMIAWGVVRTLSDERGGEFRG
jgi:uncharacterized membrane protein YhhN